MMFSIIIPVYNRRDEVASLLESLANQTVRNFECIVVDDGSTEPCAAECEPYKEFVRYYWKENEGRSPARNYGMAHASGDYFVFFDSDCVIPPTYFETLEKLLNEHPTDCYGGPDAAHESFTPLQKAINFAMTSFLTTGGIRGGKIQMEKFTPRTFNMGFSRKVYERAGGFREMFSEDIDMSTRIRQAGFSIALLRPCAVYHRRRVNFRKFFRQVYVFGMSRITLKQLYPGSLKLVHTLPALFLFGSLFLIAMGIFVSPWWLLPLGVYIAALFIAALCSTRSLKIAMMAVPASLIQLYGYGAGFLKAWFTQILLRKGRNINQELNIRKGENE
ncbi:MAG: glycosyltransferase [Bacteroides sp.]|nr:glycosyltransferase [Bacteroides sp.]MCM1379161.1 glycosyltransferase [Bacteroides sp.]MCM1445190.1 glycosyltransferase [Prevotella sp.]